MSVRNINGVIKRGKSKAAARVRRQVRGRKRISGTTERPRLVVSRSSRHLFVQVVDDTQGRTVVSASTMESDLRSFLDALDPPFQMMTALMRGSLAAEIVAPPPWEWPMAPILSTSTLPKNLLPSFMFSASMKSMPLIMGAPSPTSRLLAATMM